MLTLWVKRLNPGEYQNHPGIFESWGFQVLHWNGVLTLCFYMLAKYIWCTSLIENHGFSLTFSIWGHCIPKKLCDLCPDVTFSQKSSLVNETYFQQEHFLVYRSPSADLRLWSAVWVERDGFINLQLRTQRRSSGCDEWGPRFYLKRYHIICQFYVKWTDGFMAFLFYLIGPLSRVLFNMARGHFLVVMS